MYSRWSLQLRIKALSSLKEISIEWLLIAAAYRCNGQCKATNRITNVEAIKPLGWYIELEVCHKSIDDFLTQEFCLLLSLPQKS